MSFTPPSSSLGSSVAIGEIEAATLVTEADAIASNDNDTTIPTSAAVKDYADAATATMTNKTLTNPIIGAITSDGSAKAAEFADGASSWAKLTGSASGGVITGASTSTAGLTQLRLILRGGTATTTGSGGAIQVLGGDGFDATGNGGSVSITGGDAGSGGDANGGSITLKGGVPQGSGTQGAVIIGGTAAATPLRLLEPSGSGTNYSEFKAVAQSANITYSLPPTVGAAGSQLTDAAGDGVLTWASAGGSTIGYTLQAMGSVLNAPNDSTSYYFGGTSTIPSTTADASRLYIPKAGTIKRVQFYVSTLGTLGTNETSSLTLVLNNSGTTALSSFTNDAVSFAFGDTVSVAVAQGDYIEFKWDTPTWSTNPTQVRVSAVVYIE